jgi:hypothetical protein
MLHLGFMIPIVGNDNARNQQISKTPAKESTVIRTKTHKKHTHTKQKSQHNLRLETTAASETFPQTQGPLPHVALLRRRHGAIVADDTSTDRREGPAWHLLSVVL